MIFEASLTDINSILQVKPVINLLKQTLVGTGALLVGAVSLFAFATPVQDYVHSFNASPTAASSKPTMS